MAVMAQCGTAVDSGVVLVLVTSLTPTRNTANTSAADDQSVESGYYYFHI